MARAVPAIMHCFAKFRFGSHIAHAFDYLVPKWNRIVLPKVNRFRQIPYVRAIFLVINSRRVEQRN